jgi:hypothetical protein
MCLTGIIFLSFVKKGFLVSQNTLKFLDGKNSAHIYDIPQKIKRLPAMTTT